LTLLFTGKQFIGNNQWTRLLLFLFLFNLESWLLD
jgi:hypothetical protein